MSDASFASLGPTLLARKGGAKPAMRPQLAPLPEMVAEEQLEDLGWNDMGQDEDADSDAAATRTGNKGGEIVALNPANEDPLSNEGPLVKRQQRRLAERLLKEAYADPAQVQAKAQKTAAKTKAKGNNATKGADKKTGKKTGKNTGKNTGRTVSKRRAAFTLRLDPDRHLKLRLAATMQNVSAQVLVTEALDAMLGEIEDLDLLAARMKRS